MICLCFRCECSVNIELMEIRTQKCSLCGYLVDSILYELCKRAIFSNFYQTFTICRCRIPHGMRGLKSVLVLSTLACTISRIPHGMRGLKSSCTGKHPTSMWSHPAWDAWIEIICIRPPVDIIRCRIPHGMRGLKLNARNTKKGSMMSHPAWDAWIEI